MSFDQLMKSGQLYASPPDGVDEAVTAMAQVGRTLRRWRTAALACLGVLLALYQRIQEIGKGEADDAKNY